MELGSVIGEYAIEYMGDIYFSSYTGNSFYRYNKMKKESYRIGPVNKHPLPETPMKRLYKSMCPMGKKIYLFPWTAESLINVYDLDTEEMSQLDITMYDSEQRNKITEYKICDSFAYGKDIYAVGLNYPCILRLDTDTNTVFCVTDYRNENNKKKWNLYFGYGFEKNTVLFIPIVEESAFLRLDLRNGKTRKIAIKGDFAGFTNGVMDSEGNFYFLERWSNRIVHTDENGYVISIYEIPECPRKTINQASYFDCLICEGNGFFLFPVKANHIYYFDFDNRTFEICSEFEEILENEYKNNPNGRVYGFSHKEHYAIENAIVKMWNYCKENEKKNLKGFIEYMDLLERYNIDPSKYQ